jgi:hypothetical protein
MLQVEYKLKHKGANFNSKAAEILAGVCVRMRV